MPEDFLSEKWHPETANSEWKLRTIQHNSAIVQSYALYLVIIHMGQDRSCSDLVWSCLKTEKQDIWRKSGDNM